MVQIANSLRKFEKNSGTVYWHRRVRIFFTKAWRNVVNYENSAIKAVSFIGAPLRNNAVAMLIVKVL